MESVHSSNVVGSSFWNEPLQKWGVKHQPSLPNSMEPLCMGMMTINDFCGILESKSGTLEMVFSYKCLSDPCVLFVNEERKQFTA